jgi:uncharacterized protein (DUF1697 family)
MSQFMAFLRGINVAGYRPLKMKELREMFIELGLNNVSTYIHSGTVIFDGDEGADSNFFEHEN